MKINEQKLRSYNKILKQKNTSFFYGKKMKYHLLFHLSVSKPKAMLHKINKNCLRNLMIG